VAVRASRPDQIVFWTGPSAGTRAMTVRKFLDSVGAPPPVICSLDGLAVERHAAQAIFGWSGLPVYDWRMRRLRLG